MDIILRKVAEALHPERSYPAQTFRLLGKRHGLGMLESALAEPQQGFQGRYLYRTIFDKAGALFWSLALNHAFQEGNKRLAVSGAGVFLLLNGYLLCASNEEVVRFTTDIASRGSEVSTKDVARWLRRWSVPLGTLLDERKRAGLHLPEAEAVSAVLPALESLVRKDTALS